MSQKKVDKYKNNKFGRSSAQKKERVEFVLEMAAWILIAALFVGWIGYSAYAKIQAKRGQCESRYSNGYISTDRLYFRIIIRQRRVRDYLTGSGSEGRLQIFV